MPDRDLNRRSPFGVDEKAVQLLHAILSQAARNFEDTIRLSYSGEKEISEYQKERLESEISDCATIEYVVSCTDKTSNHRMVFDDLINFPNYDHTKISELSVSIGSYKTPKISLQLETDPSLYTNIRCKVSGDYGFINDYGSRIEDWLRSIQKKYRWAYKIGLGLTIVVAIISVTIPIIYFGIEHIKTSDEATRSKLISAIASLSLMAGLAVMPILVIIGRQLFPIGEFAIGRGAGRQRRREHIVYSLLGVAVLVGFVVTVFGNLVTGVIIASPPQQ